MLKKHFTYSELGIISLCSFPYYTKPLIAPIVDGKYIKWFGKRKTWIVSTQILTGLSMLFLAANIDEFVESRRVYTIAITFSVIMFCLSVQDIAIDGWCITMVKEENQPLTASVQ